MRMMLKCTLPVERGNAAIRDGSLRETIRGMMDSLKPEAAYFFSSEQGERACMMVFDMADTTQMARIAEPLFHKFGAAVHLVPVMNADDLRTGLAEVPEAG